MKKFSLIYCFSVLIFFSLSVVYAKNQIQEYLDDTPYVLFESLPDYQEFTGETYSLNGEIYSQMRMTADKQTVEGYLFVEYYTADEITKITFNSNFRLIDSRTDVITDDEKLKTTIGFDTYQITYDDIDDRYIVQYYSNDIVISDERLRPDWDSVSFDSLRFLLQAVLINNGENFKTDAYMIELGSTYKVKFELYETSNLKKLESKFDYPISFNKVAVQDSDVYVFEINPKDISGQFTGITFYSAYKSEYPYEFIAYWGGSKTYAEYDYVYED